MQLSPAQTFPFVFALYFGLQVAWVSGFHFLIRVAPIVFWNRPVLCAKHGEVLQATPDLAGFALKVRPQLLEGSFLLQTKKLPLKNSTWCFMATIGPTATRRCWWESLALAALASLAPKQRRFQLCCFWILLQSLVATPILFQCWSDHFPSLLETQSCP